MRRLIVAYYSRTGHTRQVGTSIAQAMSADIEEITEVTPRPGGFLGNIATSLETLRRGQSAILRPRYESKDYDMLILGTQVWAGSLPPPIRAYLAQQADGISNYALFCTLGGMGAENVFREIARLVGSEPVAKLVVTQDLLASGAYRASVDRFAAQLREWGPAG